MKVKEFIKQLQNLKPDIKEKDIFSMNQMDILIEPEIIITTEKNKTIILIG